MSEMNYYKPLTSADCVFPWEGAGFDPSFVGFANRDSVNTPENTLMPVNVRAMGVPLAPYYNDQAHSGANVPFMATTANNAALMIFDTEPVLAAVRTISDNERLDKRIYKTLYRDLNYINRVYNVQFESIDLQFVQIFISDTMAHLAHLVRMMDISQITMNPFNMALTSDRLLAAFGFTDGISTNNVQGFPQLVDFVNTQIIAPLNEQWWVWDFVPVSARHAALFSEIYKDNDEVNNYANLYAFKPKSMHHYTRDAQNSTWLAERMSIPTSLWEYARALRANIEFMMNDLSFIYIQTCMQAIMEKGRQLESGVKIAKGSFPFYPYFGRPLEITYSAGMLLAIHNATLLGTVNVSNIYTQVNSGDQENEIIQTFNVRDYSTSSAKKNPAIRVRNQLLRGKQPYNLPAAWSPDAWQQMIAASQFKTINFWNDVETDTELSPKTLGTEILTHAHIYAFNGNTTEVYEISGCFLKAIQTTGTIVDGDVSFLRALAMYNNFAFAPLLPIVIAGFTDVEDSTTMQYISILGYTGDTQHLSFVDFRTLETVKTQWVYNAYGYPMQLREHGSFFGVKSLADSLAANVSTDVKKSSSTGDGSASASKNPSAAANGAEFASNGKHKLRKNKDGSRQPELSAED